MIAKQYNIEPPTLLLRQNADWYPQMTLSSRLKATTKIMYGTDSDLENTAIEGTVLGQVDPDGMTSPFWRVQYPRPKPAANANADADADGDGEAGGNDDDDDDDDEGGGGDGQGSFVFERSIEEVWAACWAWEAHHDGWLLSGNVHIGAAVAKAVDAATHMETDADTEAVAAASRSSSSGWRWVMGRVVGFGGEGADNLDEHGDEVWRVHYEDYDSEDMNQKQLIQGMRNADKHKADKQRRRRNREAAQQAQAQAQAEAEAKTVAAQQPRKRQRVWNALLEKEVDADEF